MSLKFELYWSFRSPYSYLATPRLVELRNTYDVAVAVKPVYPIAIRSEDFFAKVNPLWPPYLGRDTRRIAERLGLAYAWPNPDPVYMDPQTRRYPPDRQPHIHRLTRLGVLAVELGRGLDFLDEVSRTIWGGTADWHEGDHLAEAARRAGLDLGSMEAALAEETARLEAVIQQNQADLAAAGHWGVPTMVFQGEPFFGQDRIEDLVWRMESKGLQRR